LCWLLSWIAPTYPIFTNKKSANKLKVNKYNGIL
jgi:hypothetical protein